MNFYSLTLELSKYMKTEKETKALRHEQTGRQFKEFAFKSGKICALMQKNETTIATTQIQTRIYHINYKLHGKLL